MVVEFIRVFTAVLKQAETETLPAAIVQASGSFIVKKTSAQQSEF